MLLWTSQRFICCVSLTQAIFGHMLLCCITLKDAGMCRDVAPDLELLELQQISQQLQLLLGQCGSIHPSEPGFGPFARSILKLLEHLLVFPMTTQLLSNVNIIVPVHKCSNASISDLPPFQVLQTRVQKPSA